MDSAPSGELIRLQKLLAAHGHGSRRACEELILAGRVEVDGQVVNKLGSKVDAETQKVTVDGERLVEQRLQYFALNKPPGVVSTAKDPSGRMRVIDMIKTSARVYNVGRLDQSSEGLILVTNDGDLANKLTHPRYGIEKKYHVLVAGCPDYQQLADLKKGIYLAEAKVQVANVTIKKRQRDRTWLEIILDEGRNREIRRILARIGHKVYQLRRVAIGPLALGDLPVGMHRQLTSAEVKKLKSAANQNENSGSQAKRYATGGKRTFAKKAPGKSSESQRRSSFGSRPVHKKAGSKVGKTTARSAGKSESIERKSSNKKPTFNRSKSAGSKVGKTTARSVGKSKSIERKSSNKKPTFNRSKSAGSKVGKTTARSVGKSKSIERNSSNKKPTFNRSKSTKKRG